MTISLSPCSSCARHVRRSERVCPFCAVALSFEPTPMRVVTERLGRAAIFSIGAAAIGSVAGCGARTDLLAPAPIAAHDSGQLGADVGPLLVRDAAIYDAGAPSTHYGGPPHDAFIERDAAIEHDLGGTGLLYGGPFFEPDAGDIDMGCSNADYGAPPPPPCR